MQFTTLELKLNFRAKHIAGRLFFRQEYSMWFASYNKGLRPKEVTTYLIKEASGNYLIQPLTNSNKRMFLRIQRLGHGL